MIYGVCQLPWCEHSRRGSRPASPMMPRDAEEEDRPSPALERCLPWRGPGSLDLGSQNTRPSSPRASQEPGSVPAALPAPSPPSPLALRLQLLGADGRGTCLRSCGGGRRDAGWRSSGGLTPRPRLAGHLLPQVSTFVLSVPGSFPSLQTRASRHEANPFPFGSLF